MKIFNAMLIATIMLFTASCSHSLPVGKVNTQANRKAELIDKFNGLLSEGSTTKIINGDIYEFYGYELCDSTYLAFTYECEEKGINIFFRFSQKGVHVTDRGAIPYPTYTTKILKYNSSEETDFTGEILLKMK